MTERAVPFYCPYCGEEDLRPAEQTERVPHGAWYCAACLRTFALKMIGIGIPDMSERTTVTAPAVSDVEPGPTERSETGRVSR
jgi:ribosomal protein L37AE/L43A